MPLSCHDDRQPNSKAAPHIPTVSGRLPKRIGFAAGYFSRSIKFFPDRDLRNKSMEGSAMTDAAGKISIDTDAEPIRGSAFSAITRPLGFPKIPALISQIFTLPLPAVLEQALSKRRLEALVASRAPKTQPKPAVSFSPSKIDDS